VAEYDSGRETVSSDFATDLPKVGTAQPTRESRKDTMHLLVILLQQLLGMLPSKQPVPQAEVVRPRSAEPRNSDSSSFAGYEGAGYEGAWGNWTVLPMLEAKEIRAPWGAEFHRRRNAAGTAPPDPGKAILGKAFLERAVNHFLPPGKSPGGE
jgi:hypothetical protein